MWSRMIQDCPCAVDESRARLTKRYGTNTAVDDLSFALGLSETVVA